MLDRLENLWIIGGRGRLGRALERTVDLDRYRVLVTDQEEVDITDLPQVLDYADRNQPDIIVNAAGLRPALCESLPLKAFQVNALGARNAAIAAKFIGAKLLHLSTDDVFSGDVESPRNEFSPTDPKSVYGWTKAQGEAFVQQMCHRFFIVRSSWVYDFRTFRKIEKGVEEKKLSFSPTQVSTPTSANLLADFVASLMETSEFGLYHFTCEGSCSRREFVEKTAYLLGLGDKLKDVVFEGPEKTLHPDYAVLDTLMLRAGNWSDPPHWEGELSLMVQEYMQLKGGRNGRSHS